MQMFEARYQGLTKTIMASSFYVARRMARRFFMSQCNIGVPDEARIAIVDLSVAAGPPQASPDDRRCQGCRAIPIDMPNTERALALQAEMRPHVQATIDRLRAANVSPWAQLDQSDLDKVHAVWTRRASDRPDDFVGAFCGL